MATFEQSFAESGRQGELDALRASGGFDQAKAQFEASGGSSGGFSQDLQKYLDMVEQYSQELEKESQNNFDFITKFLDKQHKVALGNDDKELAKFYESVSNSLEERVGRIPFDFQQRSEREKQDLQIDLQTTAEQRQNLRQQQAFEKEQADTQREQSFQARGLEGSGIQAKASDTALRERALRFDPQFQQLDRFETGRQLESARTLADITTTARRDSADFALTEDQRREGAKIDLDRQLADIRRDASSQELIIRAQLPEKEQRDRLNA